MGLFIGSVVFVILILVVVLTFVVDRHAGQHDR
jgi:hypothetical protein